MARGTRATADETPTLPESPPLVCAGDVGLRETAKLQGGISATHGPCGAGEKRSERLDYQPRHAAELVMVVGDHAVR